jgi:hypothetical protein
MPIGCSHLFHAEFVPDALPYRPPVLFDQHAPVPFVILARARTGSNLLVHTLWEHPLVHCDGEALHTQAAFAAAPLKWTVPERDSNRVEYLDRLLTVTQWPSGSPRVKVGAPPVSAGFKAFTHHLTQSEFTGLSTSPMVRKLVLRRANFLDEYVSMLKAQATGAYLRADTSSLKVTVEPSIFIDYLHAIEAEDRCIDEVHRRSTERYGGDDWHFLEYSEMVDKGTMAEVMQGALNHILPVALRTPVRGRLKETLTKQDTSGRNASIANFGELCSVLRPMPRYFAMLVEGLDAETVCPQ